MKIPDKLSLGFKVLLRAVATDRLILLQAERLDGTTAYVLCVTGLGGLCPIAEMTEDLDKKLKFPIPVGAPPTDVYKH